MMALEASVHHSFVRSAYRRDCRSQYLYVAPAPWIFRALWAIISPWMNAKTRDRVKLVGSCGDLEEFIAKDQRPTRMAGSDTFEYDPTRDTPKPLGADPSLALDA